MSNPTNSFDTEYLSSLTLEKLKKEARYYGITGYTTMRKDALLTKIKDLILTKKRFAEEQSRIEAAREQAENEHRLTREKTLRQQENPNDACLEYPYSFLTENEEIYGSGYDTTPTPLMCQEETEDVGDFPNNVEHYYWVHEGENDEEPWITLCLLTNGVYVFYKGECDYTGFDCQGNMELYASKNPAELIEYAMSISDYRLYVEETNPPCSSQE